LGGERTSPVHPLFDVLQMKPTGGDQYLVLVVFLQLQVRFPTPRSEVDHIRSVPEIRAKATAPPDESLRKLFTSIFFWSRRLGQNGRHRR